MSTRIGLSASECAEQFRQYAKANPDAERARAYNHAADFLNEFCAQFDERKSTETRWPNVQAVLMDEDEQLEVLINDDKFFVQTIYSADDAGEGKTLELALDSLEQKIAERKESK